MTRLVVNVPDTAEGAEVEVFPYGVYKVGEIVDLGYDVLDENGNVVAEIKCYNPSGVPETPVNDEGMDADDASEDEGEEG